jgi:monoamine oxidase
MDENERCEVDVAVVGAGISGLVTARELRAADANLSVLVFEARDRVGGRTLNAELGGGKVVELGGQWIGPGQERIAGLARELGITTFPTYDDGARLVETHRGIRGFRGQLPSLRPPELFDYGATQRRLDRMARTVLPQAPWTAPNALEWDSQTAWSWVQSNMRTRAGRELMCLTIEVIWSFDAADVSLLHVLACINAAGGLEVLAATAGGAQQDRFVGGSQLVSLRLARELGDRVRLACPVRRIAQEPGGALLHIETGPAVRARFVVIALSPALTSRIDYEPPLPGDRDQLTQRMPQGTVIKCMAVYPGPFWRKQGLSGQVASVVGPVKSTFDNSPPDGSPGVLLGFVEGRHARALERLDAAERRAAVLACFERFFGSAAAAPVDYLESPWSEDPWTRGCYAGYMTPGGWTSHGAALRQPVGRIHWAGSETATRWIGFMDGAVSAGQRAAREILARRAAETQVPTLPSPAEEVTV